MESLAREYLSHVEFDEARLHWMLGFLLFAGALTVDRRAGAAMGRDDAAGDGGTVISMFIVAGMSWPVFAVVGSGAAMDGVHGFWGTDFTDRSGGGGGGDEDGGARPKSIETVVAAESLFNDGVGVVLFLTLAGLDRGGATAGFGVVVRLLFQQTLGGAALGFSRG